MRQTPGRVTALPRLRCPCNAGAVRASAECPVETCGVTEAGQILSSGAAPRFANLETLGPGTLGRQCASALRAV
jgi:hypothetical protein